MKKKWLLNPFLGNFDYYITYSDSDYDSSYLRLDCSNDPLTQDLEGKDYIKTRNLSVSYSNGKISSVAKSGGRTLSISRTPYGYPSTISDGTRTWTFSYNSDNSTLSSVAVT